MRAFRKLRRWWQAVKVARRFKRLRRAHVVFDKPMYDPRSSLDYFHRARLAGFFVSTKEQRR